jgi:competence protein ComEC
MFYADNKQIPENSKTYWVGEVLSDPVVKNGFARFELSLFLDSAGIDHCNTQVQLQVKKSFLLPKEGQIIALKSHPERIQGPMNPGEFDYASYLESLGILYRCFIREGEWKLIADSKKVSVGKLARKAKKQLWEKIENLQPDNRNLGVLYAISLGSKDLLTPEIKEAYSSTGAMHVLVVSGQHIALIWMVLSYIFIWLKNISGGKYLQFFIICGLIWFYTFMTGVTASVVRASGMFTLVSLGKIIQKESSIYNSLSVSAFFGLLFCPQWLKDPGFQLSYIAVLSIVFFQPRVSSIWTPKSWAARQIWEIASVSIAAQIGTLPLTLFYFNRFPPWFILSNILVIPLVTIIMILFIVMLLFWISPLFFSAFLKLILFLIDIMNTSLRFIEKLPSPGMDMIYLTDFQMLCFVIIIIGITLFIQYKRNFYFFAGLYSLLLLISAGSIRKLNSLRKSEIILFSVPGKMILGAVEGNKGMFLHNAPDSIDIKSSFNFSCRPFVIRNGIEKPEIIGLDDSLLLVSKLRKLPGNQNYYFRFDDKSIIILNSPETFYGMRAVNALHSDILIVNNRIPKLRKGQSPLFLAGNLIISSSLSKYYQVKTDETGIIQADTLVDLRKRAALRF